MTKRTDLFLCAKRLHPWIEGSKSCNECLKLARKKWSEAHPDQQRKLRRESARRNTATRKAWDAANPKAVKATAKRWREANPESLRARNSRRRARKRKCDGTHNAAEWKAILVKANHRCAWCGDQKQRLTKDHIIPLARGGTDYAFNLQPMCRSCNSKKQADIAPGAQASLFDNLTKPQLCRNGLHPRPDTGKCKPCFKANRAASNAAPANIAAKRAWDNRNRARVTATTRAWQAAHPERLAAADARYRETHREVLAERRKAKRASMARAAKA
jgi:hypothetical protein